MSRHQALGDGFARKLSLSLSCLLSCLRRASSAGGSSWGVFVAAGFEHVFVLLWRTICRALHILDPGGGGGSRCKTRPLSLLSANHREVSTTYMCKIALVLDSLPEGEIVLAFQFCWVETFFQVRRNLGRVNLIFFAFLNSAC